LIPTILIAKVFVQAEVPVKDPSHLELAERISKFECINTTGSWVQFTVSILISIVALGYALYKALT